MFQAAGGSLERSSPTSVLLSSSLHGPHQKQLRSPRDMVSQSLQNNGVGAGGNSEVRTGEEEMLEALCFELAWATAHHHFCLTKFNTQKILKEWEDKESDRSWDLWRPPYRLDVMWERGPFWLCMSESGRKEETVYSCVWLCSCRHWRDRRN